MHTTIVKNIIIIKHTTKILKIYAMNKKKIAYIDCVWKKINSSVPL